MMVRVAIVGCGMFAGAHARRLAACEDVRIAALCSRNPENIQKLVDRRLAEYEPAPERFGSTAEMYSSCELDAVVLVTPHYLHYEQAVEALDADCHVLIEKPMVTKSDDAAALAEKASKSGKTVIVGYNTSFSPACIYTRDAVRSGDFGRLELVSAYLSQDWKRLTAGMWRHDPERSGGGQAFDSGAHLFNTLLWCVESPVTEVMAYVDNQDDAVDINSVILLRFDNGVLASLAIGGNSPPDGTHTAFVFDGGANPDSNFIDAIMGKAEPLCTAAHGAAQAAVMDAVYESAKTGRPISPRYGGR